MRPALVALLCALPLGAAPRLKDKPSVNYEQQIGVGKAFYTPALGWVTIVDKLDCPNGPIWVYNRGPQDTNWHAYTETIVKWLRDEPENRRK